MITPEDIKLLVDTGEGYNAEFKVSVPSKVKEISEEVCAFANAAGGVVLIGVNDHNQLMGVNVDNSKRSAIQNSLGDITPHLECSLKFVEVEGKHIGVIEVLSGANKPYVLSGAIYVRQGPNTQKLTTSEQMRDFFQQADKIYFDEVSCPAFKAESMVDNDFLQLFKTESKISTNVSDEQIFSNLKLMNDTSLFKNGAVLFFGKEPESIINTAIIRCVAYRGTDKRFIKDDKPYGGNLYTQYMQSLDWLHSKLDVAYDIEGQGSGPRKEIWEIPETVFKEAIINALAHRDYYDKGGVCMVELFDDRVEISNPGGLVSAIPVSEFGKRSHSRNPLIFGLFARIHLVEKVGSGVARMKQLMVDASLPLPAFNTTGIFSVIFQRPENNSGKSSGKSSVKGSVKSSVKIIEMIIENPTITIPEMANKIGLSTRAVEKQIARLKEKRELNRVGSDKDGYWEVINEESK